MHLRKLLRHGSLRAFFEQDNDGRALRSELEKRLRAVAGG